MSLENYFRNGWLRKEATSPQEIADQMGIVARCVKDAHVEGISDDLRFHTAFNAILALSNTALRASGYRATTQPGHHTRTIETLEYTAPSRQHDHSQDYDVLQEAERRELRFRRQHLK